LLKLVWAAARILDYEMTGKSKQTWVTVITVVIGILGAVGLALYSFINAMQVPLHPTPQAVPSFADAPPSPAWAGAVGRARETARAGHVSKSLASAAVGTLLEADRIRLDDEIQAYVPDFPKGVADHSPPVDGAHRRRQALRQ
jgi:hypothetical protein